MLYDYARRELNVERGRPVRAPGYRRVRIEYDSPAPSAHPEADRVVAYLFLPRRRRSRNPVVFLHGMGSHTFRPLLPFPRDLALMGVPSLFLVLPCHYERAPEKARGGGTFFADDLENSIADFRQAVVDVRSALDFMTDEGLGRDGFTLLGISFGGMIGTIAMGVDGRIRSSVLVAAGGNLMHIVWHSLLTGRLRQRNSAPDGGGCNRTRCRRGHRKYRDYLRALRVPGDLDRVEPPLECFLFDPLTFAHFVGDRKVVMYNAVFDPIMPHRATEELWEEFGRPERHFLLCEHNTIVFYRKTIVRRTAQLAGVGSSPG